MRRLVLRHMIRMLGLSYRVQLAVFFLTFFR